MKKVLNIILELFITTILIIVISCLPVYVQTLETKQFISALYESVYYLFHPSLIYIPQSVGEDLTLFEVLRKNYLNTMVVLLASFIVSLIFALIITYIYIKSSQRIRRYFSSLFFFLESIPDVLMVIMLQFLFIVLFKKWGISFSVVALNEENPIYLLPIICLSNIPTLQLFKYFSSFIEEEEQKIYSDFLRAKGLSKDYIIWRHLFRNALIHFLSQSKSIIMFMLSNLLILELVLNINGLMVFIKSYGIGDFRILMWCLIVIYMPFLLFYKIMELFIRDWKNEGRVV
ncbi:ABC transporter permease subunit [Bacillus salacetis]|uniref:ABC transporter permease subunit n=1 Tax=Bacillus salacetis TaxID=2315464 RepID=UPI003BA03A03